MTTSIHSYCQRTHSDSQPCMKRVAEALMMTHSIGFSAADYTEIAKWEQEDKYDYIAVVQAMLESHYKLEEANGQS